MKTDDNLVGMDGLKRGKERELDVKIGELGRAERRETGILEGGADRAAYHRFGERRGRLGHANAALHGATKMEGDKDAVALGENAVERKGIGEASVAHGGNDGPAGQGQEQLPVVLRE